MYRFGIKRRAIVNMVEIVVTSVKRFSTMTWSMDSDEVRMCPDRLGGPSEKLRIDRSIMPPYLRR